MIVNQPYDRMAHMRFQVSMLNLAASLEPAAPIGSKDASADAMVAAERLQELVARHEQ